MREVTTTDLSKFGYWEWVKLRDLLNGMIEQDFPDDFVNDGVNAMFNRDSGHVFLTNSEYQTAMMNGDKLESWYYCYNCGHEGFAEDCQLNDEGCNECQGSEPC